MPSKDRKKFREWHTAEKIKKDGKYDFNKEFTDYCVQDVKVLRLACEKFRNMFMEVSEGLCPFSSALTIAGLSTVTWRTLNLKRDLIGLVPSFRGNRMQSKKALQFLSWLEKKDGKVIQHAGNGEEKRIGPYWLDGYIAEEDTAIEFHGC
jgi:hypothetical protein